MIFYYVICVHKKKNHFYFLLPYCTPFFYINTRKQWLNFAISFCINKKVIKRDIDRRSISLHPIIIVYGFFFFFKSSNYRTIILHLLDGWLSDKERYFDIFKHFVFSNFLNYPCIRIVVLLTIFRWISCDKIMYFEG